MKTRIRSTAIAACLLITTLGAAASAQATGISTNNFLVLSTGAYHFKKADERNALTPGIGWEYSPSNAVGFHLGTLSDSFGYQAKYAGLNYATPSFALLGGRTRLLLGVTALNKQYHPGSEPETKVVPLPAVEFRFAKRATLNISGSPQIDYAGQRNNAVLFFQFKLNLI